MATGTPNFGWPAPTVGGDNNAWGTELNFALTNPGAAGGWPVGIDDVVKTVQTTANAALPKAGGTSTGLVNQFTETVKVVAKGTLGGAVTLDLSTAQYFTITHNAGVTYTFSNPPATGSAAFALVIRITNGATGSAPTWPASVKFPGGTAPVFSTAGTDMIAFVSDDAGTTYRMTMFNKAYA